MSSPANPLLYRKMPRDAVIAALNASLNANLFAFAASYAWQNSPSEQPTQPTPFGIDFTGVAGNFVLADVDWENSPITNFPALAIFTPKAKDTGSPRGLRFSGPVFVVGRFCVRYRTGAELPLMVENTVDWIEDSFMSSINDPSIQWPPGVNYDRESSIDRDYKLTPLADGWQLVVEVAAKFNVFVN